MYYVLPFSPWPIVARVLGIGVPISLILGIVKGQWIITLIILRLVTIVALVWLFDLVKEWSRGSRTSGEVKNYRKGFLLFIVSEALLFFRFFWTFFHRSLAPTQQLGCQWPPIGIVPIELGIPLLNTGLLLLSGVSLTWSHHAYIQGKRKEGNVGLIVTIALGFIFFSFQVFEYLNRSFRFADRVFGRIFFLATGFHGAHVVAGALLLSGVLYLILSSPVPRGGPLFFELAAWYWHFVDVVWLFLFICVYWWGSLTKVNDIFSWFSKAIERKNSCV